CTWSTETEYYEAGYDIYTYANLPQYAYHGPMYSAEWANNQYWTLDGQVPNAAGVYTWGLDPTPSLGDLGTLNYLNVSLNFYMNKKTPKVPTYGCTLLAADMRTTIGDLMSSDRPTKNSFSAIIVAGTGQILANSISKNTNYTTTLETAPHASLKEVGEYLLGKYGSYTKVPTASLTATSGGQEWYYETERFKLDSMDSLLLIVGVPSSEV
ncbi:hypothetical protein BDK51DRAFT_29557, partial [Blyttiomyces helicus]